MGIGIGMTSLEANKYISCAVIGLILYQTSYELYINYSYTLYFQNDTISILYIISLECMIYFSCIIFFVILYYVVELLQYEKIY